MPRKRLDLTGKLFGKLTPLRPGQAVDSSWGETLTTWICRCSCGSIETIITKYLLRKAKAKTQCHGCRYAKATS